MKNKIFAATGGLLIALSLVGYGWYSGIAPEPLSAPLEASLGASAEAGDEQARATLIDGLESSVSSSYDLSAHQTLSRVILLIRENYVDPERVKPYDMFLAALDYIQKTIPEVMVDDSAAPERITVSVGTTNQVFELGDLDQLWEVTMALRDIFRFLQGNVTDSEKRRDIEFAAINGMLSTLDPHSVLLKPESFDEVRLSTKGEFGGLGIVISIRDGALAVISPIAGTPAAQAGLKAKDQIVKIGEESTVNMSLEEAVQRLRGKPNTQVAVWVLRKNWTEPKRFELTRAIIKIESVTSEMLAGGVGYVRIKSFQNNTYDDLRTQLQGLRQKNGGKLKGLVLDLRNNPGGLLDQAILVSDRFVERGALVITVGEGNRKREVKPAHATGTDTDYPIAVLINGGSASASEIVSGALKNHDRAIVIGQTSFGKGSVQVLYDFKDKSALKLTIAQYLTPGDVSIQSVGITPDVEVVPATVERDAIHLFADIDSPREKDLEMHLERHGKPPETVGAPLYRVTNLLAINADEEPEENVGDEFKSDFEIELARDVLAAATSTKRPELLAAAQTIFQSKARDQDAAIVKRMASFGVDWGLGAEAGAGRAEATLALATKATTKGEVAQPSKADAAFPAGETVVVTATVKNTGTTPLYRVYGVSESESPLLKNREFVFGKLLPGASRSWSVEVKLPKEMGSRADQLALKLGAAHDALQGATVEAMLRVAEIEKPRFAYQVVIDDRKFGNGDGLLQVGEKADLQVSVSNLGPGVAEDTLVTLKNQTGDEVFLDRGRDNLGKIGVGQRKVGRMRFMVTKPVDTVQLRLGVWDNELGVSLTDNLTYGVSKAGPAPKTDKSTVKAEAEVPVYGAASATSGVIAHVKAGSILKSEALIASQWRRVELADGAVGFVESGAMVPVKGKKATRDGVRWSLMQAPPEIELSAGALATNSDMVRLQGTIRDERKLCDMFVFVNDKKVYYRSLAEVPAHSDSLETAFDVSVALKQGSNNVAVVVRENEEIMSRKVIGIFRGEPSAMAMPGPSGPSKAAVPQ